MKYEQKIKELKSDLEELKIKIELADTYEEYKKDVDEAETKTMIMNFLINEQDHVKVKK